MTTIPARIRERCLLHGSFTLRSGKASDHYFDKYRFESDPGLLNDIARALLGLVPPAAQVLAGLEMGGIPIATSLSLASGLPAAYVRKERKTYGTCRIAEGAEVAGKRVVIVEDIVSSGGAIVAAVDELRREGAQVDFALCVIDRETGGREALRSHGIELRALLRESEVLAGSPKA
jgi:orotate phosphoribosyltransferase